MKVVVIDSQITSQYGLVEIAGLYPEKNIEFVKFYRSSKTMLQDIVGLSADIVLVGLHISSEDAFDVITNLKAKSRNVKVALFSCELNRELIMRTIKSGAHGIISKSVTEKDFVQGLVRLYLHENFTVVGLEQQFNSLQKKVSHKDIAPLTMREQELLEYVKGGIANKDIAAILNISISTVEFHRKNIYCKLRVSNVAELLSKVVDFSGVP